MRSSPWINPLRPSPYHQGGFWGWTPEERAELDRIGRLGAALGAILEQPLSRRERGWGEGTGLMDFDAEALAIEKDIFPPSHHECSKRMQACDGWCYCRHVRETIANALRKAYEAGGEPLTPGPSPCGRGR